MERNIDVEVVGARVIVDAERNKYHGMPELIGATGTVLAVGDAAIPWYEDGSVGNVLVRIDLECYDLLHLFYADATSRMPAWIVNHECRLPAYNQFWIASGVFELITKDIV